MMHTCDKHIDTLVVWNNIGTACPMCTLIREHQAEIAGYDEEIDDLNNKLYQEQMQRLVK